MPNRLRIARRRRRGARSAPPGDGAPRDEPGADAPDLLEPGEHRRRAVQDGRVRERRRRRDARVEQDRHAAACASAASRQASPNACEAGITSAVRSSGRELEDLRQVRAPTAPGSRRAPARPWARRWCPTCRGSWRRPRPPAPRLAALAADVRLARARRASTNRQRATSGSSTSAQREAAVGGDGHDGGAARVGQRARQLVLAQARAQRDRDRAGAPGGEQRDHERGRVRGDHRHPLARDGPACAASASTAASSSP